MTNLSINAIVDQHATYSHVTPIESTFVAFIYHQITVLSRLYSNSLV